MKIKIFQYIIILAILFLPFAVGSNGLDNHDEQEKIISQNSTINYDTLSTPQSIHWWIFLIVSLLIIGLLGWGVHKYIKPDE